LYESETNHSSQEEKFTKHFLFSPRWCCHQRAFNEKTTDIMNQKQIIPSRREKFIKHPSLAGVVTSENSLMNNKYVY
jgi:hypothetical protein